MEKTENEVNTISGINVTEEELQFMLNLKIPPKSKTIPKDPKKYTYDY